MKYKIEYLGLTFKFDSFKVLADHYTRMSSKATMESLNQKTVKEQRFYQGKAAAYREVADFLVGLVETTNDKE